MLRPSPSGEVPQLGHNELCTARPVLLRNENFEYAICNQQQGNGMVKEFFNERNTTFVCVKWIDFSHLQRCIGGSYVHVVFGYVRTQVDKFR